MSLRLRLLLALLGLATAGLLVADAVTYTSLNSFLTKRLDQQLSQVVDPTSRFLSASPPPTPRDNGEQRRSPFPAGTYAALIDPQGNVINQTTFSFGSADQTAPPDLPNPLPSPQGRTPVLMTQPGGPGGEGYRMIVANAETGPNRVLVAVPRTEIQSTLGQLLLLETGVGVVVLVCLGAFGAWVVRLGLRPLDDIAETAGAIAAGDLQRRVSPATPRTEVGRLGLALNAMLARIEESFAARRASEDRLRRFVADASHELRTPVASIRGYAELFRRGASIHPDDLAMSMRRIEDEATRMGHLVDDLLLLARLDEGRPLERGPVDLSQLAADAAADARALDSSRTVGLSLTDDAIVTGDEMRLRQVVSNLIRNAVVHTPPGTPIEVSTDIQADMAVMRVIDHGPGIPTEAAERIFERFYRADPARARAHGSTGLGLSIVAAVVAAHGGSVDVTATPGGGATFTVRLRLYGGGAVEATEPSLEPATAA